ncbi:MAG: ROK family protein [Spirochaetia bacterium]
MQYSAGKPKTLKKNNRKFVLDILRNSDVLTISEISKNTHLSKTTVIKILDYLIGKNLVIDAGKGSSTHEGGKKPNLYSFNHSYGYILSAQIFSEELYFVITDLTAKIIASISIFIQAKQSTLSIVKELHRGFEHLLRETSLSWGDIIAIAVGSHGITDSEKGVVIYSPHFSWWPNNVPFKQLLLEELENEIPIHIDNWLRFQAYAELKLGCAKGYQNIVVVDGGVDGLAAGMISSGKIVHGEHFLCGEIGHTIVNPQDTVKCVCGGMGCFEMAIEVKRLMRRAQELIPEFPDTTVKIKEEDGTICPDSIFESADRGDTLGRRLIDEIVGWFAIGLSNLILTYDPQVIIIQGLYAGAGEYFRKQLEERIKKVSLVPLKKDIEICYSRLGKERGPIGSSLYAIDEYFSNLSM